jgi:hypothetical protein
MKPLKQLAATSIFAAALAQFSCSLCAYEQGTYFIYDIVTKLEDTTVAKRLPLNSDLFIEQVKVIKEHADTPEGRSDFEINYSSLGTSHGSFDTTISLESSSAPVKTDTSSFGFGQSATSAFGH